MKAWDEEMVAELPHEDPFHNISAEILAIPRIVSIRPPMRHPEDGKLLSVGVPGPCCVPCIALDRTPVAAADSHQHLQCLSVACGQ